MSKRSKRRKRELKNLSPLPVWNPPTDQPTELAPQLNVERLGTETSLRAAAGSFAAFAEMHIDAFLEADPDFLHELPYHSANFAHLFGYNNPPPEHAASPSTGALSDLNLEELNFATEHLPGGRRRAKVTSLKYRDIPPLVTPDTIGDAVAYMDRDRVFGCGWWVFQAAGKKREWWTRTRPDIELLGFHPISGRLLVARRPHPLGVSYDMDDCAGIHGRNCYSEPGTAGHRARVVGYGSGAAYVSDDCEGWDAVYSLGNRDESTVHLGSWRQAQRVWVACGSAYTFERKTQPPLRCYEWSGSMAFDGEAYRTWWNEVKPGHMPPRVFVEWLCENFRVPLCMVRHLRYAGFEPCKN